MCSTIYSTIRRIFVQGCFGILLTIVSSAAMSANYFAHIMVVPEIDKAEEIIAKSKTVGLSNCKQLVEQAFDTIVIRIHCNELLDLQKAIADLLVVDPKLTKNTSIWIQDPVP